MASPPRLRRAKFAWTLADKSSKRNADEITPAADKFGHRQDYKPRLENQSGLSFFGHREDRVHKSAGAQGHK